MTSVNTFTDPGEENAEESIPGKMQQEKHQTSNGSVPKTTIRGRERIWSTCVSTLVASVPALLIGYTVVFPSSALLVLMGDWREGHLPSKAYLFSTELADVFGVSNTLYIAKNKG